MIIVTRRNAPADEEQDMLRRLTVSSKGASEPVVTLKNRRTAELRNRRVEIWVR